MTIEINTPSGSYKGTMERFDKEINAKSLTGTCFPTSSKTRLARANIWTPGILTVCIDITGSKWALTFIQILKKVEMSRLHFFIYSIFFPCKVGILIAFQLISEIRQKSILRAPLIQRITISFLASVIYNCPNHGYRLWMLRSKTLRLLFLWEIETGWWMENMEIEY